MPSVESLREFVNERLTAAAEEIFGVFRKTVLEYEEEIDRQRRLLDIAWKPEIQLHRTELPQQHVCKEEEVLADQQLCVQERNSSLDQEDPEPPQIKEEQEELCSSQEGEQLVLKQETDAFMLTPTYEESDDSEPEPNRDHQLLSHSSHVAESQDQARGKHEDSGSTRDAEPDPNNQHHSNNVYTSTMSDIHYNTHPGENQYQARGKHEDSGSTRDAVSENQKVHRKSHSNNVYNSTRSKLHSKKRPGHISTSRVERLLNSMVEDNSEVEDLSDSDAADPGVELNHDYPSDSTDLQSSDDSAEMQRSSGPVRKRKRGPSAGEQGQRWKSAPFAPDVVPFEAEDERLHERQHWQPLDYVQQYMDTELMKLISHCTNAMSLVNGGRSLNTTVDEIYHFFGASILMSCVPYQQIRMFWSNSLRIPAVSDKIKRDRFFKLRQHLKIVIDDDISEEMRRVNKFWKVWPFMDRIRKGCLLQARPEWVSIVEQMIPFTGACPFRQFVPLEHNPVGMKNFVLASAGGIVLDFEVYQGAKALSAQVQDTEGLGLGALVIARLSETLRSGTKVYCDRWFTTMKAVDQMLDKQVYLTGMVLKNRVSKAQVKLPSDKDMKLQGRGTSASVTRGDGKVCVVKWYDIKPVLMVSTVHAEEPKDTCQRWSKMDKQYVNVTRPSIVREYSSKMGGLDLRDRMMSYYHMSVQTKKWTVRMLMHFTDLALANSWLLYRQDNIDIGTPRKGIMQFLEFRMTVAQAYLSKCNSDGQHVLLEHAHPSTTPPQQGPRRQVTPVRHISSRTTSACHLPEMVNLRNPMRCREKGCSGKSRVRCVTCNVFLCLQTERNCFAAFHTAQV
ncbi:piggyBac transposable element-derived protein 3 isoform X2 [Micropterus dolomieu]|uniref:piggyBac transposable element-derived protein 3 isoform X2 n=1 Tax=Micropterus dolomieu TaxID=147949 RepID=UPI001E8CE59B|nr:piggyBac transposable element-derived protein 3 isoform X2 [Micropterus dolomieu]